MKKPRTVPTPIEPGEPPTRPTLGDMLRAAIVESGLSYRAIDKQAGIGIGQVSRFMSQDPAQRRDLTLESASKVAEVLGLTFTRLPK